ncbi:ATP-binding protein [Brevibacterium litoralis]|uniref:ATP-binding protein n=1 Tax=Brevibacterium litoralis TaxID=3138935 RepID=UPI0032F05F9D
MTVTIPPPPSSGSASPFTPGFGTQPPTLVGRQAEVDAFARAIDGGPGARGRATLVTGQRGVGKTVLLGTFREVASTRQWITVQEQASPGFAQRLARARLPEVLEAFDAATTSKAKMIGLTLPAGLGGVSWRDEKDHMGIPDIRTTLMTLLGLLEERGTGLLITLDEVHRSTIDELRVVTDAMAHAIGEGAPLAFVAAGLPHSINGLVNDEVSTYLRRAERVELGYFDRESSAHAIRTPIEEAGKTIDEDALALATDRSEYYPYLVQLLGDLAWEAAGAASAIAVEHVEAAVGQAREIMGRQIHEPTLDPLSARDLDYLRAMALDDGPSRTVEIARRMSVTDKYASTYRRRLVDAGVVVPAGHGLVDLAVPYLREHLRVRSR